MAGKTFKGLQGARKSAVEESKKLNSERIIEIESKKLIDSPLNAGLPMDGLDTLADSLRAHGLLEPIIVYQLPNDTYEIVSGHRRREVWCNVLGNKTILCRVREYPATEEDRFREHATANIETREKDPFFWMAEIENTRKFIQKQYPGISKEDEKAKITEILGPGASKSQIWRYDTFRELHPDVQTLCRYGLSINTLSCAKKLDDKQVEKLVQQVGAFYKEHEREELTRADFINLVKKLKDKKPKTPPKALKKPGSSYEQSCYQAIAKLEVELGKAKTPEQKEIALTAIRKTREQLEALEAKLLK